MLQNHSVGTECHKITAREQLFLPHVFRVGICAAREKEVDGCGGGAVQFVEGMRSGVVVALVVLLLQSLCCYCIGCVVIALVKVGIKARMHAGAREHTMVMS